MPEVLLEKRNSRQDHGHNNSHSHRHQVQIHTQGSVNSQVHSHSQHQLHSHGHVHSHSQEHSHNPVLLPTLVAVLYKALLDPMKYDNYRLWSLLTDEKINAALVIQAAEEIPKNLWMTRVQYGSYHITYPPTMLFLQNLLSKFLLKDQQEQLLKIIRSCLDPKFEEEKKNIDLAVNTAITVSWPSVDVMNFNNSDYLGHPKNPKPAPKCNIGMNVLAGFITALGIAAVAIALATLSGVLLTAVAVTGAALALTGMGLFAYNAYRCSQQPSFKEDASPSASS